VIVEGLIDPSKPEDEYITSTNAVYYPVFDKDWFDGNALTISLITEEAQSSITKYYTDETKSKMYQPDRVMDITPYDSSICTLLYIFPSYEFYLFNNYTISNYHIGNYDNRNKVGNDINNFSITFGKYSTYHSEGSHLETSSGAGVISYYTVFDQKFYIKNKIQLKIEY